MTEKKIVGKPHNTEGLVALYNGVIQNLSMVHAADDAIENKIAAFFAASIVVLVLVLNKIPHFHLLADLGFGVICIELLISLNTIWSRNYHGAAVNINNNTDYLDMESNKLILQLIADAQESFTESASILDKKSGLFRCVLVLFTVGSTLCLLAYV